MDEPILSVVRYLERPNIRNLRWNPDAGEYEDLGLDEAAQRGRSLMYIGSGGHLTEEVQKAQVFGWPRSAQKKLDGYRCRPEVFEVIPIRLVPATE